MHFYRNLQPFKLISFDLDDTLYDNTEVIDLAEQAFLRKLQQESQLANLPPKQWQDWKSQVAQQNPLLSEDVIAWRIKTLKILLSHYQKNAQEIEKIIKVVMDEFVQWRHKISVPLQSIEVLDKLAKKFPLVAITNGNVDPKRIGLHHFSLVLRGGEQGRAKPHMELFHQTAYHFQIQPQDILHVGDHLISDIQGAIQAGCQAVWINLSDSQINQFPQATLLPTVEIKSLMELLRL